MDLFISNRIISLTVVAIGLAATMTSCKKPTLLRNQSSKLLRSQLCTGQPDLRIGSGEGPSRLVLNACIENISSAATMDFHPALTEVFNYASERSPDAAYTVRTDPSGLSITNHDNALFTVAIEKLPILAGPYWSPDSKWLFFVTKESFDLGQFSLNCLDDAFDVHVVSVALRSEAVAGRVCAGVPYSSLRWLQPTANTRFGEEWRDLSPPNPGTRMSPKKPPMTPLEPSWRPTLATYLREQAQPPEKFGHQPRLYALTRQIGQGSLYDDDIVYAAAYLHDLGVFTGHRPEDPTLLAAWNHVPYTLDRTQEILTRIGFPPSKIPTVLECIQNHQPHDTPLTLESTILRDADILEQLGAIGIARTLCKVGRDTRFSTFTPAAAALARALDRLPPLLRLPTSRTLAAPRIQALRAYLAALCSEAGDLLL